MKKCLWFLFLPTISWSANTITTAQTDQVGQAASQIVQTAQQMQQFAVKVRQLITNGYQYNVDFSTNPVTLTAQQQTDIIAYYQQLKAQLVGEFNQLP